MILSYAPYRLQFKHPFGTAHGIRTGTDAVFVRLEEDGVVGFGEAALPPYLRDTLATVIQDISYIDLNLLVYNFNGRTDPQNEHLLFELSTPCRAALSTAYFDLKSRQLGIGAKTLMDTKELPTPNGPAMVTLGYSELDHIALKLSQLPNCAILKVKLGSDQDVHTLSRVMELDNRQLFLDANQGWNTVAQVLELIALAGEDRIVGIEQPFGKENWGLHKELSSSTSVPVIGDESIQGLGDLDRAVGVFGGVNIKLIKCGGIDRATEIIFKARQLGLQVMLGCMSESSLGCGAMAQLAPYADLVDLDGPWLIGNDPFNGLVMEGLSLKCSGDTGLGIELLEAADLSWTTIDA